MEYQHILWDVREKIAWVILNRADQLNAMNSRMMEELIDALGRIHRADADEVRVGVIMGAGKAFMAGADIKEYATQSLEQFAKFQLRGRDLYQAILGNDKPVIAAVNGYAFGGGLEIALACDMIVAIEGAPMGLPEIKLGLIPGGGGTQRLTRKLGVNLANEMIMTGRTVKAEEMRDRGVVNYVYPRDLFIESVHNFAATFVDKSPGALSTIKRLTALAAGAESSAALAMEASVVSDLFSSEDGQAHIQAFYQKSVAKDH